MRNMLCAGMCPFGKIICVLKAGRWRLTSPPPPPTHSPIQPPSLISQGLDLQTRCDKVTLYIELPRWHNFHGTDLNSRHVGKALLMFIGVTDGEVKHIIGGHDISAVG